MKERAMAPPATPPSAPQAEPVPMAARKEFSLTSGAEFLGVGTATLRAKLKAGEIPHEKKPNGQYVIQGAALFQYQSNREADEKKHEATRVVARASRGADTPASISVRTPVDTGAAARADTPADTVSKELHDAVVEGLKNESRLKSDTIHRLETDVDSWKNQANKLQEQAATATRLLEDHSQKNNVSDGVEQGGDSSIKWWLSSAAMAVILFGVIYAWQDEIGEAWQSVTAPSVEPMAQSEDLLQP